MAPKLKPIDELGFVAQERCGKWRAVASLCGHLVCGPSRSQASAAQADLQVARSASTRADMAAVLNRLKTEAANMSAPHAAVAEEQAEEIRKLKKANEVLMQDNQNLKTDNKKMKTENQSLRALVSMSSSFRKDVIAAAPDARGPFVESTQSSALCRLPLNQREASLASSADRASTACTVPERPMETESFHRGVYPAHFAKRNPERILRASDIPCLPIPRVSQPL